MLQNSANLLILGMCVFRNSEYEQETPQSQTADTPMTPQGRATQQSKIHQDDKLNNAISSLPHQDDCKTRMDMGRQIAQLVACLALTSWIPLPRRFDSR